MQRHRTLIVSIFVTAIILLAAVAVVPMIISAMSGPGVPTDGIDAQHAKPAATDVDGTWVVSHKPGANATSVGYTFDEVLPGDRRTTSGSTTSVDGHVTIEHAAITGAKIEVDLTDLSSDNERRDINAATKILETDVYPTATFEVVKPVDIRGLPSDGTIGEVSVPGRLTIHGHTHDVTATLEVLRDGEHVVIGGDVPLKRSDYGVKTPEFVAASIADDGALNLRVRFDKDEK
ncbi:YceI family protein [Corynebacterium sp. c6VSa_13]|uniref:YceI family protein n=1 Tax=Corynebacterium sp. c6VSa_13 TaxID=2913496 RepID=UPI0022BA67EB|nr:YceI family protein [Corynebacterium sp. c6VSa_13]MCZ9308675.1 YceI family protein [Corynebacterium sp. c6VSa_13]